MTKQALRRTVGFCAAAWQASARRWVDGALRYVTATPGLAFRDFSFLEEMAMDELAPAPSWQGKADGMILAFGLREDEPADATMRWIERGGLPAVSLVWDWRHPRLPVVATDFAAVMTCAAEYFIRQGFDHFAFVGTVAVDPVGFEALKLLHRLMDGAARPEQPLLIGPEGVVERESTCAEYREGGDVRRAVEFIRRHACEGIKVADVVRHLRIARRTLDQHFADRLGHSPAEEIRRVRLDRARKLLAETGLSVGRVAELAGFRDLAQFNATFRQLTGLPPAEFRQRERK